MNERPTTGVGGTTIFQALLLAVLCAAVGLAVNIRHIVGYAQGEYRTAFAEPAAPQDPPSISRAEAEDFFASGQAVFIDARAPEEFEAGHIPGAKNVPLYDPGSDMIWESLAVSPGAPVVVYCSGDLCRDGLVLAGRIARRGWRNVKVFIGGWAEWSAAGLPVESGR